MLQPARRLSFSLALRRQHGLDALKIRDRNRDLNQQLTGSHPPIDEIDRIDAACVSAALRR